MSDLKQTCRQAAYSTSSDCLLEHNTDLSVTCHSQTGGTSIEKWSSADALAKCNAEPGPSTLASGSIQDVDGDAVPSAGNGAPGDLYAGIARTIQFASIIYTTAPEYG